MSTTRSAVTTPLPAGLLSGLVDDAALFPPGNAPMAEAVPSHLRFREQSFAELFEPPESGEIAIMDSTARKEEEHLSV